MKQKIFRAKRSKTLINQGFDDAGVTLLEIIVAMVIASVLFAGVAAITKVSFHAAKSTISTANAIGTNSVIGRAITRDIQNSMKVVVSSATLTSADMDHVCTTYVPGSTSVRPLFTGTVNHSVPVNSAQVVGGEIYYYTTQPPDLKIGEKVNISGLYAADGTSNFNVTGQVITSVSRTSFAVANSAGASGGTSPAYAGAGGDVSIANGQSNATSYVGYEVRANGSSTEVWRVECPKLSTSGASPQIVTAANFRTVDGVSLAEWDESVLCIPAASLDFTATGADPQPCPKNVPLLMGQRTFQSNYIPYLPGSSLNSVSPILVFDNTGNAVSGGIIGASVNWPGLDPAIHAEIKSSIIDASTGTFTIECQNSTHTVVDCGVPQNPVVFRRSIKATVSPLSTGSYTVTVLDTAFVYAGMFAIVPATSGSGYQSYVVTNVNGLTLTLNQPLSVIPPSLTLTSLSALDFALRLPAGQSPLTLRVSRTV